MTGLKTVRWPTLLALLAALLGAGCANDGTASDNATPGGFYGGISGGGIRP